MLLPLESPVWKDISACYDNVRAHELLCGFVESGRLGEQWSEFRDEIYHQGTIYGMTSAALPHLIRLAPSLSRDEQRDLWIDIAFLVYNGAGSWDGREPVPGMQQTLTEALDDAETLALQAFLADDSELDPGEAGYYALACVMLAGHEVGGALEEHFYPGEGYVRMECPGCATEYEVDGFGDPFRPPCAAPPLPELTTRDRPEWTLVPVGLPPGFEEFSAVARAVADAGLPTQAPAAAVWCLVAAMVASKGATAWARTLLRLTGDFRCEECDSVQPITAMLWGDEGPATQDPATVADSAGFKPAPGGPVAPGDFTLHPVPLPDDFTVPTPCEVPVQMGTGRGDARPPWLAELRDGRTLLATGDDSGAVQLRDPLTGNTFGELWRREGRPVSGMAFGEDLVVVYGDLTVDVWSPRAVSGTRSTMAPKPDNLAGNGHQEIAAVCNGAGLGFRKPMVLADRNGTVSLWETFGVRLADPLPPDPGHREVFAVTASHGFVVTASRADASLRIWHPDRHLESVVRTESAPQWITYAGEVLVVGFDGGPVSFAVR